MNRFAFPKLSPLRCVPEMGPPADQTVTIRLFGEISQDTRQSVLQKLQRMIQSPNRFFAVNQSQTSASFSVEKRAADTEPMSRKTEASASFLSVRLGLVEDAIAFARRIDFGRVVAVRGRLIDVVVEEANDQTGSHAKE